MAERRMFAKAIIDSDAFIDMPVTARLLYYDLGMRADDDGFVNSPKKIMRMVGASQDDLAILISKKFIIPFETGVVVIKHWRIHNYIRQDRYKPTKYEEEKNMLTLKENGSYTLGIPNGNQVTTNGCQVVDTGKDRLGKDSIGKNIYNADSDSVIDYLNEKAHTNYRHADGNRKFISARLKEGFSVDDCKTVIDKKCQDWLGTEYEQYLRPKTLFGNKFEGYLNANVRPRQKDHVVIDMPDYMRTAQQKEYDPDEELPF